MQSRIVTFSSIQEKIHTYMTLDSRTDYLIDLVLAAPLSVYLDQPLWLMVVGPPSSGKTELLSIISQVEGYHALHNLTAKTLFSGRTEAAGGFMLREVGENGILVFPDFTTVLSGDPKSRKIIYNQLRLIYDGRSSLSTGSDTGPTRVWEGKVSVIGGVTEKIEAVKERSSDLGERFLYFRYRPPSLQLLALGDGPRDQKSRDIVQREVKKFVKQRAKILGQVTIGEEEKVRIASLAQFIARGRAPVERDGMSREIRWIHQPEQPHRVYIALLRLYQGLLCIHDEQRERPAAILREVAKSTIPESRLRILIIAASSQGPVSQAEVSAASRLPETAVRRTIEDLIAQGILCSKKGGVHNQSLFGIDDSFQELWRCVNETVVSSSEKGDTRSDISPKSDKLDPVIREDETLPPASMDSRNSTPAGAHNADPMQAGDTGEMKNAVETTIPTTIASNGKAQEGHARSRSDEAKARVLEHLNVPTIWAEDGVDADPDTTFHRDGFFYISNEVRDILMRDFRIGDEQDLMGKIWEFHDKYDIEDFDDLPEWLTENFQRRPPRSLGDTTRGPLGPPPVDQRRYSLASSLS